MKLNIFLNLELKSSVLFQFLFSVRKNPNFPEKCQKHNIQRPNLRGVNVLSIPRVNSTEYSLNS